MKRRNRRPATEGQSLHDVAGEAGTRAWSRSVAGMPR